MPVFTDTEAPLPGEMIVFVVIRELGFDGVGAAGDEPFRCLLHGGEELMLLYFGSVAADHVVRLVNCT